MIDAYENERRVMEEKYNAVMFAREGNLDIPLPIGFATPDDAMTPASMIPIPPPAPKIHAGILKKPVERKLRKVPPGPPCIPPPEYDDYGDVTLSQISANTSSRKFKPNNASQEDVEDNYDPVEIPSDLHHGGDMPSLSQMFPSIMSVPLRPPPMPHLAAHPAVNRQNPNSIISAPAQVVSAPIGPSSQPVIAAGPQMRDLWKETTRFIPANVQLKKKPTTKPKRPISYANPIVTTKSTAVKESPKKNNDKEKSKDDVCDEFLASLGFLFSVLQGKLIVSSSKIKTVEDMLSSPKTKNETDRDRIYELFSAFDSTKNNTIAVSEIPVLIRVLGLAIKEADIKPLLKNWTDKCGKFTNFFK
uniref:EF-hand domain-containing protein n=1 Tax=Panagrolaimus superbus TaxID=310955 RepID=A0A914Z799_9BILA